MPAKKGFWKKKDGTMVQIKEMEDVHLIHTIEMFKKELCEDQESYLWTVGSFPSKFFELQLEAYTREILPVDSLILHPEMPEEYIPEGMKVGLR